MYNTCYANPNITSSRNPNTLLPPLLLAISVRYLIRHPLQFGLCVLGVALGVAVVVSIDLANASASRAFSSRRKR